MVTDDYRLQNCYKHAGGSVESVANAPSKHVWIWEQRCKGCEPLPPSLMRCTGQRKVSWAIVNLRFAPRNQTPQTGLNHSFSSLSASSALTFVSISQAACQLESMPTALARSMSTWSGVRPPASRSAMVLRHRQAGCFVESPSGIHLWSGRGRWRVLEALSTEQHEEQQEQDAQFKGTQSADHGASSLCPGAPRC